MFNMAKNTKGRSNCQYSIVQNTVDDKHDLLPSITEPQWMNYKPHGWSENLKHWPAQAGWNLICHQMNLIPFIILKEINCVPAIITDSRIMTVRLSIICTCCMWYYSLHTPEFSFFSLTTKDQWKNCLTKYYVSCLHLFYVLLEKKHVYRIYSENIDLRYQTAQSYF